jgi:hypothetical protein
MPINFPSTPSNGQQHEEAGRKWTWDGNKWNAEAYVSSTTVKEIRTVSGDTTLLASDAGNIIRFTGTNPQTLTIPDVIAPGASVTVIQDNSGLVGFASSGSVNLLSPSGNFETSGQNSVIEIVCVDVNEYRITGDVNQQPPFTALGGSTYVSGGYKYHKFTSNGTFEIVSGESDIECVVIAGGGHGGYDRGGGGGAGGVITTTLLSQTSGSYPVVVGAGAPTHTGYVEPVNGNNSTLISLTAIGGGAAEWGGRGVGNDGGSGGGAGSGTAAGTSSGTAGQGYAGGGTVSDGPGGGGGGAGGAGQTGQVNVGANGGPGISLLEWAEATESGVSGYFAGGGGTGNKRDGATAPAGLGGSGGGGNGGTGSAGAGAAGVVNTGSGGGGGANISQGPGGAGGSGIVIIRYPV